MFWNAFYMSFIDGVVSTFAQPGRILKSKRSLATLPPESSSLLPYQVCMCVCVCFVAWVYLKQSEFDPIDFGGSCFCANSKFA